MSKLEFLLERLATGRYDSKDLDEIRVLTQEHNKNTTEISEEIASKLCPSTRIPGVGDWIYVQGAMSFDHGHNDVAGGLGEVCEVTEGISGGKTVHFVKVKQHGHRGGKNWEQFTSDNQEKLAKQYGHRMAYPSPDYNNYDNPGEWK